jgi:hemerythrin
MFRRSVKGDLMGQMQWSLALAVGHEVIDAQHQELFRRFDALVTALKQSDRATVGQFFDFLGEYVVIHFAEEERLMQATAYPGLSIHRAAHERFTREYADLRGLYDAAGASTAVTVKTETWIFDWLKSHIAGTDIRLAEWLRNRKPS